MDEVRQPLGQRLERPDTLGPAKGIIGVSGGRIVAVLENVRGDAVSGQVLIEGARWKDVGRGQSFVFERVALFVAGVAERQRSDDIAGARLVIEPLEYAALTDRHARMDAGDVTGRRRGKLRRDRRGPSWRRKRWRKG